MMSIFPHSIRNIDKLQMRLGLWLALILAVGAFLRIPADTFTDGGALQGIAAAHPQPKSDGIGFDEGLYRGYVNSLAATGLGGYPDIVAKYIEVQKTLPGSILPPTRFLYIFAGYAWHTLFGCEALTALHHVAAFFSVGTLCLAALFAWRIGGAASGLAVAALMAFAPTQIHMSQHALVDGFFTFWALLTLWLFWENLHAPRDWRWLVPYIFALSFLVLTKENSFFVWVGLVALIITNRWLQFGTVTRELLIATALGPMLGAACLIILVGGADVLLQSYSLSVGKNYQLTYAIMTGDGPWHRYLVDLLLVSPIVLILAIGSVFRLRAEKKPELFFAVFVAATYAVMCNVKYGMNLRYANMWDMPLRMLAFAQIAALAAPFPRYRNAIVIVAVAIICAAEFRQYLVLFVNYPLYELVSEGLLRALNILKSR